MKKLNDFKAEKVNVNSIYGGLRAVNNTTTLVHKDGKIVEVKADTGDAEA